MSQDNQLVKTLDAGTNLVKKVADGTTDVAKWAEDNHEVADKAIDGVMDIGRSLASGTGEGIASIGQGTGDAVAAIGKGTGGAIQAIGRGVEALMKTPAMVQGFKTHLQEVQTLSEERLQTLAAKYSAWERTFSEEAKGRETGMAAAGAILDRALKEGDRDLMLKALAGMITVLEKTDLVRTSSILTSEWKGNSTPGVGIPTPKSLLEDNGEDFDSGL